MRKKYSVYCPATRAGQKLVKNKMNNRISSQNHPKTIQPDCPANTTKHFCKQSNMTRNLYSHLHQPDQVAATAMTGWATAVPLVASSLADTVSAGVGVGVAAASFVSLEALAGGGGGGTMCAGGVCFSFTRICRSLERSVGFPGLGP
ncbi:hypothetical protein Hanom_Chr12g01133461 [Helianthus anomalus]